MNNQQLNWQFNASNPYLSSMDIQYFSFAWYNLMSICRGNGVNTYIQEDDLLDINSENIQDVNGENFTMDVSHSLSYTNSAWEVGIAIQKMNAMDLDNLTVEAFESSIADYGGVIDKRIGNKTITLDLFIQGSNHNDLISRIGELKKNTQLIEQDFVVTIGGQKRTYKGTVSRLSIPSIKASEDFVEAIKMDILVTNQWEWESIEQLHESITGDVERVLENVWEYEMFPRILMLAKTWTATSKIEIGTRPITDTTAYSISLTSSVVSGDIIEFDYKWKTVKKNGVEMEWDGVIMPIEIWYNVFEFDFTGTANFDIYIIYNPVYL